jgi:hypothetical protein
MKNADTGSTVRQASTAAKLNQPAQGSTMHKASQNASWNQASITKKVQSYLQGVADHGFSYDPCF